MMEWDEFFDIEARGLRPFSDFEWYATDRRGQIALLTSAGFGAIPLLSFRSRSEYLAAAEHFEGLPLICGSTLHASGPYDWSSWIDASRRGLFGYDFDSGRGQYTPGQAYELIASPERPLRLSELPAAVRAWLSPIRFAIDFSRSLRLFPEREFAEVNL